MPQDPPGARDEPGPLLVPVGESATLRQTVAYAVREGLGSARAIHFVAPVAWHDIGDVGARDRAETEALLERVAVWAEEDAEGDAEIAVETAIVGESEYLFGPDDYARVIADYARANGIDRVLVDPQFNPGGHVPILQPMEASLADTGLAVDEAPVARQTRRGRLLRRGGARQFATLFGISFLFYQLLGELTASQFDLVTGVASATLVAAMLHRITFNNRLRLRAVGAQLVRLVLYTPYLLYEIVVANLQVSYAILHPDLPIEPRMAEVECALWGGMPVTTLANSITLTPGTLTVRVRGRGMVIHTLLPASREGLFDGGLERGVRFVFYGRQALAIASPKDRGDTNLVDAEADGDSSILGSEERGDVEEAADDADAADATDVEEAADATDAEETADDADATDVEETADDADPEETADDADPEETADDADPEETADATDVEETADDADATDAGGDEQ